VTVAITGIETLI